MARPKFSFEKPHVRIGTRGSALAMAQATAVQQALMDAHPGIEFMLRAIKTRGDRNQDKPLHQLGNVGLFTREIEQALLDGKADVAVHSLKDLPAEMRPGLELAAVPQREDARDVLICPAGHTLAELPEGATVATGALRRRATLRHLRPDLELAPMRGNLETRLRKVVQQDDLDATLVGAAGLARMGWLERATEFIDPQVMIPAGGQGAIGLQIRAGDDTIYDLVDSLNHEASELATAAERAFLARLGAGCQVPVAVYATMDGDRLVCDGMVAGLDGTPMLRDHLDGDAEQAEELGRALAERLLAAGAQPVLDALAGDLS